MSSPVQIDAFSPPDEPLPLAIPANDGELLMRFSRNRDESAFEELVRKHASLVLGTCRQILRNSHDADDAFQATFLILARRSNSIRRVSSLSSWLYKVAYRTAMRAAKGRQQQTEQVMTEEPVDSEDAFAAIHRQEQLAMLHEELNRLPEHYQAVLALCYLEGKSRNEAAEELDCTDTAVKARLARGRKLLRMRLMRRGVALSSVMTFVGASLSSARAGTATPIVEQTIAHGLAHAISGEPIPTDCGNAFSLAHEGVRTMYLSAIAKPAVGVLAAGILVAMCVVGLRGNSAAAQSGQGEAIVAQADAEDVGDTAVEADLPIDVSGGPDGNRTKPEGVPPRKQNPQSQHAYLKAQVDAQNLKVRAAYLQAQAAVIAEEARILEQHSQQATGRFAIRPDDIVNIQVSGTLADQPIDGPYRVESDGSISLGPTYGRVRIAGMSYEEAEAAVAASLSEVIEQPQVTVASGEFSRQDAWAIEKINGELQQLRADFASVQETSSEPQLIQPGDVVKIQAVGTLLDQPIDGLFQVEPGGTVPLGPAYGRVKISALSFSDAETALKSSLSKIVKQPEVMVSAGETFTESVEWPGAQPTPAQPRRDRIGDLVVEDRTQFHAVLQEEEELDTWRWRLFIPKGHQYSWNIACENIPGDEPPRESGMSTTTFGPHWEQDSEVLVTAKLRPIDDEYSRLFVESRTVVGTGDMGGASLRIPNEKLSWIRETKATARKIIGLTGTEAQDPTGPIILLQRWQTQPRGDSSPMPGFSLWLEEGPATFQSDE